VLVALTVGLVALVRVAWFANLPLIEQVVRIPDDAFYYLVLARNFAESGSWTFDHMSTTSGFHPLHAFFLAGISAMSGFASFPTMLWASGLASAGAMSLAAYLSAQIVSRSAQGFAPFAVVAVLTAPLVLIQTTTVMESPWVILAGALCYWCVLPDSKVSFAVVALVGAFGSLARTDFGLLPLTMFVTACVVPLAPVARRELQLRLVVLLVGATVALALFLIYVHGYSGHWIQSSARMKSLWGDTADSALRNYVLLLLVMLGSRSIAVFAGAGLIQFVIGGAKRLFGRGVCDRGDGDQRTESKEAETPMPQTRSATDVFTGVSGAVAVLGYIVFFGMQNLAPQTWYSAAFVVPLSLAIGIAVGACLSFARVGRTMQGVFAALIALTSVSSFAESQIPRFPHQANMLGAALWLKEHPPSARVAAFNAGLLSYFSESDVVNLDGLVNDDIFGYASRDALADYFDDREIGYLLDYPVMWQRPSSQQRGGFSRGDLNRRLRVHQRIAPLVPRARWFRGHPILMKVESPTP
jgi:hypothetical protein